MSAATACSSVQKAAEVVSGRKSCMAFTQSGGEVLYKNQSEGCWFQVLGCFSAFILYHRYYRPTNTSHGQQNTMNNETSRCCYDNKKWNANKWSCGLAFHFCRSGLRCCRSPGTMTLHSEFWLKNQMCLSAQLNLTSLLLSGACFFFFFLNAIKYLTSVLMLLLTGFCVAAFSKCLQHNHKNTHRVQTASAVFQLFLKHTFQCDWKVCFTCYHFRWIHKLNQVTNIKHRTKLQQRILSHGS